MFGEQQRFMGPVVSDVGIVLRLPADGDQVRLAFPEDRFGLLGLEDDAHRHRGDADLFADPFGVGHLEAEAARHLRRGRRT